MLHSGSRGIGNRIGTHFIAAAKRECERWHSNLPDSSLAFLPEDSELFAQYWAAVSWAQNYAQLNRWCMVKQIIQALRKLDGVWSSIDPVWKETAVNCHHNYVAREHHFGKNVLVTRKGAVRARS